MLRSRLFHPAVPVLALVAVLGPAGQAFAAGPATGLAAGPATGSTAAAERVAPRACSWRLDTRLPLPAGLTEASLAATDGATGFAGTGTNRSVNDQFHAVVWAAGRASLLPTPVGWSSMALGMNRGGDVVGLIFPDTGGPNRPVLWRGGVLVPLGTGSADQDWVARDINDAGLIAGDAADPDRGNRAVVWSAAEPAKFAFVTSPAPVNFVAAVTEAGVLAANVIDDAGGTVRGRVATGTVAAGLHLVPDPAGTAGSTVLGAAGDYLAGAAPATGSLDANAALWQNEVPRLLSKDNSEALGVNSTGTAAGVNFSTGRAIVWIGTVEQPLPVITTGPVITGSVGAVVTEGGAVGGSVTQSGLTRPVLWHCA